MAWFGYSVCGTIRREGDSMCTWGTEVILRVPITAGLSHSGEFHWDDKGIDACIAPIFAALNAAGIYTASSCCGHGKRDGEIILHDGRVLRIETPAPAQWEI